MSTRAELTEIANIANDLAAAGGYLPESTAPEYIDMLREALADAELQGMEVATAYWQRRIELAEQGLTIATALVAPIPLMHAPEGDAGAGADEAGAGADV